MEKDKEFAFAPTVRVGSKVKTNFLLKEKDIVRTITEVNKVEFGASGVSAKADGGADGLGRVITGTSWNGINPPVGIDQQWYEVVEF